jgi:hypothetical protein
MAVDGRAAGEIRDEPTLGATQRADHRDYAPRNAASIDAVGDR